MPAIQLTLDEPLTLTISTPDGNAKADLDVYKTRRFLEECQTQPTEEKRWQRVTEYVANALGVPPETLAENVALQVQVTVNELVAAYNDQLKKRTASTASSLRAIPESPATS